MNLKYNLLLLVIIFATSNVYSFQTIKPSRLKPGDVVGFISPSGQVKNSFPDINKYKLHVQENMSKLGLKVKFSKNAFRDNYGGLAGNDTERSSDLMDMFRDPEVKAIIANRGGWGCNRILDMLNYTEIRLNPKIFMGYSDLTGCFTAIHEKTGLITFHGPMGVNNWNNLNAEYAKKVLMDKTRVVFENPSKYKIRTIKSGVAKGKLIGGNLSVFNALLGSTYFPNLSEPFILFLEDVSEAPYRIDRLLTTLEHNGIFQKASGLIFGTCSSCTNTGDTFTIIEILRQKWGHLKIPSFEGSMIGHISEQFTLPIGAQVQMNADLGTITLLEDVVN